MTETRKCPLCFTAFIPPHKWKQKIYCSRACAAAGNAKNSSHLRTKFIGEYELFQEAELLFGQREGRIPYIAKKLGCSEPTVHNLKRRIKYKWAEEKPARQFTTTYKARAYVKEFGKCVICEETRFLEAAHWFPAKKGGTGDPENIIPLCPNHHKFFDKKLLADDEKQKLQKFLETKHPTLVNNEEAQEATFKIGEPNTARISFLERDRVLIARKNFASTTISTS